jgi:hypothetical protein
MTCRSRLVDLIQYRVGGKSAGTGVSPLTLPVIVIPPVLYLLSRVLNTGNLSSCWEVRTWIRFLEDNVLKKLFLTNLYERSKKKP